MAAAALDLPRVLPVFAVSGVLLLPGAKLPLTVLQLISVRSITLPEAVKF